MWFVSTAGALVILAAAVFPGSTVAKLGALLFWAVAIVPLSFTLFFRAQRRREEADVGAALEAWRLKTPGAGKAVAVALEEALDEEDEVSLKRLLFLIEEEPQFSPFIAAARTWIADDGGRSSRMEHLDAARELARPLLPVLSAR